MKKFKNGHYALFTDSMNSYAFVNKMYMKREKCDLSELLVTRPKVTGFIVLEKSFLEKINSVQKYFIQSFVWIHIKNTNIYITVREY